MCAVHLLWITGQAGSFSFHASGPASLLSSLDPNAEQRPGMTERGRDQYPDVIASCSLAQIPMTYAN